MTSLHAIARLMRPINVLITIFSIVVAALVAGTLQPYNAVLLACISAALIAAASNTINDYYDLEIDRVNKPQRPLPSGMIGLKPARTIAVIEYIAGISLAALISIPMCGIALLFSGLMWLYSALLKRTAIWGNLAVSLSTAAAFVYGGMAVNRPQEAIIPAVFAFLFHFGREIIKDMEDVEGDKKGNAQTLPVRFGNGPAIILIWAIFIALIVATIIPYARGDYGPVYFAVVCAGVYPVICFVLLSILKNRTPVHLGRLSTLLKADMLVGLLAIYLR